MPRTTARAPVSAGGAENEEGRRPALISAPPAASPELVDRRCRRRIFTAADKVRILAEIDRAGPGGSGAYEALRAPSAPWPTRWRPTLGAFYRRLSARRRPSTPLHRSRLRIGKLHSQVVDPDSDPRRHRNPRSDRGYGRRVHAWRRRAVTSLAGSCDPSMAASTTCATSSQGAADAAPPRSTQPCSEAQDPTGPCHLESAFTTRRKGVGNYL